VLFRGTTTKKSAVAGAVAIVAGAALSAIGAMTAPADATADGVQYTCTVDVTYLSVGGIKLQETRRADMSANIAGGVSGPVHVGDSVTLSGFQTLANVSGDILNSPGYLLATSISGHYGEYDIRSQVGDAGQSHTVSPPGMDIASTTPASTGFTLTSPQAPMAVAGFPADQVGTMTFSAGAVVSGTLDAQMPLGAQQWPILCHPGDTKTIATVTVSEKPKPPTSPPSHPSSGHSSAPAGLSNPSPNNEITATPTSTRTPTAQHPQLAATGASHNIELLLSGGLLILVGTGLMYAARRRDASALDT
jgi:LPXTG-motif cell wall-anchored protein